MTAKEDKQAIPEPVLSAEQGTQISGGIAEAWVHQRTQAVDDSGVQEARGVSTGSGAQGVPPPPGVATAPGPVFQEAESTNDSQIGQYEIIRQLGEGGMGVVYLARDNRLGRRVAIKFLRTQNHELTRRFIIEARTTARCTHENIVVIHEVGEHRGSPFMVLEFLEGKSLSDYQHSQPLTVPHAVEVMVSVVRALVRAHEQGIVHRDLKPDNIFITESGTVKVLDFGIAKLLGREVATAESLRNPKRSPKESIMAQVPAGPASTGLAGTAGYMSPEQWRTPGDVDHRADIWAVGITLYELVSGTHPLMHLGDPWAVSDFLAQPEPLPSVKSTGAALPDKLAKVIGICLRKSRDERYPDARALLKALEPFLPGRQQALDTPLELGPFAGLRAFQEEDQARFFGRSRELGTMLGRLRETPLMATVGPSGVGKSSFLRAGVIPALKNSGTPWEVLVCRPGRSPLQVLAELLVPFADALQERAPLLAGKTNLEQALTQRLVQEPGFLGAVLRTRCRLKQTRLMLFIDQFEELYTLGAPAEERHAFTTALLGAADDAVSPLRVMLSVRADFLGRVTEDQEFMGTLTKGLFFLGPPNESGLREALVRPAEMVGYRFEDPAIVDEMIQFLDGTPNGLPLLQFTAAQLWEARDPQNRLLTTQSYRGMGGVSGALVSHADRVYNQLPDDLQVLCRSLFMHLVTQERTRAVRSMKELTELAGDGTALRRLVEQLVESRLWVVTNTGGDPTVEIVHESLIVSWPSLRRWLDESHEDSVFIDQLLSAAHQWEAKRRDAGLLWRGEMVAELDRFERRFRGSLPELASEFAATVRAQARRSARMKRAFAVGGVAVLVALLFAASVGLVLVNQAKLEATQNATIAEQRLEEQLRAENERRRAEAQRKQAEKKTGILEGKVKLNAEELAATNEQLKAALESANERRHAAQSALNRAEESERRAQAATKEARDAAQQLQKLLDKERARADRLNTQIGTLVEDLR